MHGRKRATHVLVDRDSVIITGTEVRVGRSGGVSERTARSVKSPPAASVSAKWCVRH